MEDRDLALWEKSLNNDQNAIYELVTKYKPYIHFWVQQYYYLSKFGYEMEDLESLGLIAFYKSLEHFDLEKQCSLKTYVYHVVKNTMRKEVRACYRDANIQQIIYLEDLSSKDRLEEALNYEELIEDQKSSNQFKDLFFVKEDVVNYLTKSVEKNEINASIIDLKVQGYTTKEISELLQISTRDVYGRIHRMRKRGKVD